MRHLSLLAILLPFAVSAALAQTVRVVPAFPNLGFRSPVDIQHAGDGSNRLFVVEQNGRIMVFANTPSATTVDTFLNIDPRVNTQGEEGLLGLAFHPDYERNGYFYVYYSAAGPRRSVIARYSVDPADPNRADPDSEQVILEVDQPYANHNGGQIAFGPDGYLYIGLGDGGSGGDPLNHGQRPSTLLGSILRIDVDGAGATYTIPPDNPFVGNTIGAREEIWAYGLRNPWRFSFDPLNGRLWAGDVGQNAWEEVDIITKGGNYGWRIMEGRHCFNPSSGCDTTGLIMPVWEYNRSLGISITGGHVYRGRKVPELVGRYVYGDFGSGRIWSLGHNEQLTEFDNQLLAATGRNISTFGVDQDDELYFAHFGGQIYTFQSENTSRVDGVHLPVVVSAAPNPASERISLGVHLRQAAHVQITLYDARGQRVRTLQREVGGAGVHRFDVATDELGEGIYWYRVVADGAATSGSFTVIR